MKCPKCSSSLKSILTRSSVIIDVCLECKGTWLDQGEINFFVKDRKILEPYSLQGLLDGKEVLQSCPKCNVNMKAGKIPGFKYEVEECPSCKGLWLDEHEFKKIGDSGQFKSFAQDRKFSFEQKPRKNRVIPMPSLRFTSALVLGSMYSVLFGLMVFLVESRGISYTIGILGIVTIALLQFLLGPILLDWSLRLFGSLTWIEYDQLPPHLRTFIIETCEKNKIPLPAVGLINDGAPQAYTYGRTPKSARLVLSSGILEILEPAESEAVVAHEIGHITHWDFVIMTVAHLVPLVLYHIYRVCSDLSRKKSGGNDSKGSYFVVAALIAYIAYIISDYLVMFISRIREYWADKFSVETTKNPNALVRALAKIAYGLATTSKTFEEPEGKGSLDRKRMAVQALGIMSVSNSKEMALYASQGGENGPGDLKDIMRWDLWSPWATYYELHSTHPLTAKRINAIANHALNIGVTPEIIFDLEKPESYWDDFFKDIVIVFLPILGALAAVAPKLIHLSLNLYAFSPWGIILPLVLGLSVGGILKTLFSYPGGTFLEHSVISLLKKIKVSPITSHAIKIRGRIIGRGDPGSIFSEDMVVRDKTGMIFLDYQHGISNWFFAFFKMGKFMGRDVEIEGWYRRAPIPFVEVKIIRTSQEYARSYTYYYKLLFWISLSLLAVTVRFMFPSP